MTKEEHIEKHKLLHKYLDELLGDFILCNRDKHIESPIYDLLKWAYEQTLNPTELDQDAE